MSHRVLCVAGGLCAALWLLAAPMTSFVPSALAQSSDAKPADQHPATGQEPAKEPQKVDEFAETQKIVSGPAGNPECVWLGRRVVSLLWRDDLDTAFRHLDLYDRFGCPGDHIQISFRCVVRQGNIDPKATQTFNERVHSCWVNPALQPAAPAPSASAERPASK
jgi:hypothetical protein